MPSNSSIGYFFVMRHPVDRAVSDYHYRIKHEPYHPLRVPTVNVNSVERYQNSARVLILQLFELLHDVDKSGSVPIL